jgi:hypothetical protein
LRNLHPSHLLPENHINFLEGSVYPNSSTQEKEEKKEKKKKNLDGIRF